MAVDLCNQPACQFSVEAVTFFKLTGFHTFIYIFNEFKVLPIEFVLVLDLDLLRSLKYFGLHLDLLRKLI